MNNLYNAWSGSPSTTRHAASQSDNTWLRYGALGFVGSVEPDLLLSLRPELMALCGEKCNTSLPPSPYGDSNAATTDCEDCSRLAASILEEVEARKRGKRFTELRARTSNLLQELRGSIECLISMLDPVAGSHDDVAEIILAVQQLGELFRQVRPEMETGVLDWLLRNEGGVRSVRVGELKYFGEKDKSVRCLDVGDAGEALFRLELWHTLLGALGGDLDVAEQIVGAVRELFQRYVSTSGIKEGAARSALADAAERELRADHAAGLRAIEPQEGETPAAALERVVQVERERVISAHWEENWPDKLKGSPAATKLGVANLRFVHRSAGGTKQELESAERKALAEG